MSEPVDCKENSGIDTRDALPQEPNENVIDGPCVIKRIRDALDSDEVGLLIFLILMILGIWLFAEIADEVMEKEPIDLDHKIFSLLRPTDNSSQPIGPEWLVQAARDITALGGYTILVLLTGLTALFFVLKRRFGLMLLTISALAGGATASSLLKLLFFRDRPALDHLVSVSSKSFPSAHAMLSAVVYLTLGALLARSTTEKKIKAFFMASALLLSMLVGISRVYLGVHFPTDVLAGWIAGAVWAILCLLLAGIIRRYGGEKQM